MHYKGVSLCSSLPVSYSLKLLHYGVYYLCAAQRHFPWLQRWGQECDSQIK